MNARRLALDALVRIEEGAYANLVLPPMLERSGLDRRDRALATDLVYGTTRMRRACDFLVDRFVLRPLDVPTRTALRLGAYGLHVLHTPAHAAVSSAVDVAPRRSQGLVNAVLRRVAEAPVTWPDDATRLSYPDWVVARLVTDLGQDDAMAALATMNEPPPVTERPDGYIQDRASQEAAAAVGAGPGQRVADLCAAPGGKATALAATGAEVAACDLSPRRAALVRANAARTGTRVGLVAADGRQPPWRAGHIDHVLVDAPCSGLGVLRRRPDARWRVRAADVDRLAVLQQELLTGALPLLRPGGTLVYSVCTLTAAETVDIDRWLAATQPTLEPLLPPGLGWRAHGRGAMVLPQDADTDGMFLLRLRA